MRAELPTIYITARDVVRLDRLARFHARRDNPAGKRLAAELRRAVICQPEEIAPDAVTMLSRIQYRLDSSAQPDERVLVYPDQFTPAGPYVSILAPLGIALIGLRVGSCMPFTDGNGKSNWILVTDVVQRTKVLPNESAIPRSSASAMRTDPECRPLDCY